MATNLTNSILTQIAIKRLSGKAMTSGKFSIPQEEYGSSVQVSAETLFGQTVPNIPISSSETLYQIQSASVGDPGTVQQVEFDLTYIDGTSYANTNSGQNDGEAEETVFGKDLGDPLATSTYHGYYITLPTNYETLSTSHFANASTPKSLGDAPFQNGFASTGSTQFQIVPEYLSTAIGDGGEGQSGNNTYAIEILNDAGERISPTSGIDYYFDSFAGILFIQDPSQIYTGTGATTPKKVRAFLYTGKYQNEIEGGNFHISGSEGGGFSISGTVTASFESGSAGITVTATPESNRITIGDATDNVTFNQITASIINVDIIEASEYIVSSSITYMTTSFSDGSTIFGDDYDVDTHQFTGSIYVTGSTFTWNGLGGSDGTTPLVIDENGNITTGSAYSVATGIHLSASGDEGFTLQSSDTASFKSGNAQLVIDATAATNEILFTVGGGVVSGSGQLLSGSGILSSSTQNFTEYSSSVETNVNNLLDSASAGIAVSSSGGVTSIALMETASFIGGDGITITNSNGTLTIESNYGELDSALHISASDGNGTSIAYTATASFSASGPGLTATLDGSEINYDINANTLIEAVDTTTVINITASYATSASYAVTASYAENAGSVSLTEETNNNTRLGVVFSNLTDVDLSTDGDVNEDVTLQGGVGLSFIPNLVRPVLAISSSDSGMRTEIEKNAIQSNASEYNILTTVDNTTINVGTAAGTVFFQGSASIAGDLIVNGTTTTLNTENLLVEDKYILLASGSGGNADGGGIIVRRASNTSGTALHWDESNAIWAIDYENANPSATPSVGTDLAVVAVQKASGNPSGNPILGGSTDYRFGQMYINTTDTDNDGNQIWIYAP